MDNRQILLKSRSDGVPSPEDFEMVSRPADQATEGKLLCKTHYISLDPYLRGKISGRHMSGTIHPGEIMLSETVSLEDSINGLEQAPEQFCRLMRGENFGKSMVAL